MKSFKPILFFVCFAITSIFLLNFRAQKPQKLVQDPGWQQQYKAMKNPVSGVNYYGLRNSWSRQDALNKKGSEALSFITEVGPDKVAGRVRALLIDAADSLHIFAGGISGGLWVTYNGGKTWAPIDEHNISMAVSCITQNPFNAKEIYYGTGEGTGNSADINGAGIFKSVDGGKTFKQLPATSTLSAFATIWDIEYSKTDSSTFYVGVANGGLYKSNDKGLTFKSTYYSSKAIHEIVTYKDSTIWFGLEAFGLITATEDSIMKFTRFINTLPSSGLGRISVNYCKKFPNVAFCQVLSTGGTSLLGIYKTSNHGATWKKMTSPSSSAYPFGWYCLHTNVSPIDTNFVLAISTKAYGSINGSSSWSELKASHADFHASSFFPSGRNLLIGNDGGVFQFGVKTIFSSNVALNNGLNITQFYTGNYNELDTKVFIGGTQDNGTHYYNGTDFLKVFGGDGSYCAFSSTPPYYNYVSYQNGELRRMDQDFISDDNIKPAGSYSYWFINPFEVNPFDGSQVYVLSKRKILVSTNSGDTWSDLSLNLNKDVLSLGMSYEKDPTLYYGGAGNTLYRSSKASTIVEKEVDLTSTAPTLAKGGVINCIKVNRTNPNTMYISMSDINIKPRVWKLNGAETNTPTWTNISGNLPTSLPVNCVEVNPQDSNSMVAGTDFGLYSTSDGGTTWSKELAVANVPIHKIVSHTKNGVIYIFTHGRGIYKSQFKNFVATGNIARQNINPSKITFNNPIENNLNLSIGDGNESLDATLQLYNSVGKIVYGNAVGSKNSLDISHLSKGIYIMNLTVGRSTFNYKVLKL
ncbi:MAG: T9SS type A sorting domain-containing protein [Bacteroidia bacterium]